MERSAADRYDGKVARLCLPGSKEARGYLLARTWSGVETRPKTGREVIGLEFHAAFLQEGQWQAGDRLDAEDYDTIGELDGGQLDWYGDIYDLEWLDDSEAAEVRGSVFGL